MNIGNVIKELRLERGFKQNEFAEKCSLSQSYLSLIEKGTKEPTLAMLKRIASNLSVPMPVLVFFSLDKNDIPKQKREAFELVEPSLKGLLHDIFISKPK